MLQWTSGHPLILVCGPANSELRPSLGATFICGCYYILEHIVCTRRRRAKRELGQVHAKAEESSKVTYCEEVKEEGGDSLHRAAGSNLL